MKQQNRLRIVLVRPKESRNVGAACRAMKCMGFTDLSLILDGIIDPSQASALAHYAGDVLDNAAVYTDLRPAIQDAVLVAGTTRRRGKRRKYFSLFPEQFAERVAAMKTGSVAVLFGNEDTGLTDEELALCHVAVTIPTSAEFQSLNLSHAVQIICYEVLRALSRDHLTPFSPISASESTLSSVSSQAASRLWGSLSSSVRKACRCSSRTSWAGPACRSTKLVGSAWCFARSSDWPREKE